MTRSEDAAVSKDAVPKGAAAKDTVAKDTVAKDAALSDAAPMVYGGKSKQPVGYRIRDTQFSLSPATAPARSVPSMFAPTRQHRVRAEPSLPASSAAPPPSAESWLRAGASGPSSGSGSGNSPDPASEIAASRHGRREAQANQGSTVP